MSDRDDRTTGPEPATADELYRLAPPEFVAARNALARRLRAAGERGQAAEVAKRRRPPPTAWALNQVARDQPKVIEDFFAAGQQLRTAMDQAVRGDASGLRAAQAGERDAVGATVGAALDRLGSGGRPAADAMIRRLTGTLHAAIVDDAVARQLRGGTLDADHAAPGLGLPRAELVADAPPPPADRKAGREDEERRRRARARRAELEANADRLERRAQRLRAVADEAAARAAEAGQEADEAEASAEAARGELVDDTEDRSGSMGP